MSDLKRDRIKKIIEHILEEPKRFEMESWGTIYSPNHDEKGIPDCNTVCCIGGWAIALFDKSSVMKEARKEAKLFATASIENIVENQFGESIIQRAAKLLGLDAQQAEEVFSVSEWPAKPRDMYDQAKTSKQRAKAGACRLKMLLKDE